MNEKTHNTTLRHFTDLKVWKDAHDLYLLTLKDVENFPNTRGAYTLSDQLLRAIGSISANIAEGFNRRSTRHYIHAQCILKLYNPVRTDARIVV